MVVRKSVCLGIDRKNAENFHIPYIFKGKLACYGRMHRNLLLVSSFLKNPGFLITILKPTPSCPNYDKEYQADWGKKRDIFLDTPRNIK